MKRVREPAVLILFLLVVFGVGTAQELQKEEETEPILPPAPIIVKKNPDAIAVPPEALGSLGKYRERLATNARVGSSFGYRRDPFTRRARFHSGLDIKAGLGDQVAASLPGTVEFAGWYHGYGNWVVINHGGGVTTHYAHLSDFAVEVGQKVSRGSLVGFAGRTGRATSPHLHYEVRIDGNPVDPLQPIGLDPDSEFFKVQAQPDEPDDEPATSRIPPPALRITARCSM